MTADRASHDADVSAIRAVLHRVCEAIDRFDGSTLASYFTRDAEIDRPAGTLRGRVEIGAFFNELRHVASVSRHELSNIEVVLGPDASEAHSSSEVHAVVA